MSLAPAPLVVLHHPAAPAGPAPTRRLLLLSYHFPPGQATGALRWQKIAGFAAERGWGLDVVTLHPDDLPAADYGRLAELPAGTRIFGVPHRRLALRRWEDGAAALLRRVRRRRADPGAGGGGDGRAAPRAETVLRDDLRWGLAPGDLARAYRAGLFFAEEGAWARDAAAVAARVLRAGGHAAVVSCGPPHMVHLAGRRVARRAGLPFVMDMRDPWSLARAVAGSQASPLWYALARRFEGAAVRGAALVAVNTESARQAMREAHPGAAGRVVTVMNGCDEEPIPPSRVGERFTVAYAGNIYIDRDPRPLFRAAARVVREHGLSPARFGLDFLGHVDRFGGVPLAALAAEEGLAGYVAVHPRRPRAEALEFLAGAAVLLSLPQGTGLAIPSKLFEYMQYPAWLLALASRGSATELLLRGSRADVVEPDDVDAIAAILGARLREHRAGVRPRPVNEDGRFSRRRQAGLLLDAIERCVAAAPAGRP